MFPDPNDIVKDRPIKAGTVVNVAGFENFTVHSDSTTHKVLLSFFRRQYPESEATDDTVLHCLSEMDVGGKFWTFGHTFYY
jgi:hypothetical protein